MEDYLKQLCFFRFFFYSVTWPTVPTLVYSTQSAWWRINENTLLAARGVQSQLNWKILITIWLQVLLTASIQ